MSVLGVDRLEAVVMLTRHEMELGQQRHAASLNNPSRAARCSRAGMRLRAEALLYRLGNPRLADTRLTRDQDARAIARFRMGPTPHQQLDLLLAPDQLKTARKMGGPIIGNIGCRARQLPVEATARRRSHPNNDH
jgi:hypothetical protein